MVVYRAMKSTDYDQAYALWERTAGMNLQSLDNSYAGIKRIIDRNPDLCFVAEVDGKLVATLLGATDGRKGFLYHVAVDEKYRGQHISSELISRVFKQFQSIGINTIGLFTVIDNLAGQSFWKHFGFKERPDIKYLDIDL